MALIILYLSGYLNSHSPFPVYKYMNFLFLYFFTKFGFYILHFQKKYANIYLELAQIAQLVEQRTENPRVTGSIPVLGIIGSSDARNKKLFKKVKKVLDNLDWLIYNTLCCQRQTLAGVVQW